MLFEKGKNYIIECGSKYKEPYMLVKLVDEIKDKKGYLDKFIIEPLDAPGFEKEIEQGVLKRATFKNVWEKIENLTGWNDWDIYDNTNTCIFTGDMSDITEILCDEWFDCEVIGLDMQHGHITLDINVFGEG